MNQSRISFNRLSAQSISSRSYVNPRNVNTFLSKRSLRTTNYLSQHAYGSKKEKGKETLGEAQEKTDKTRQNIDEAYDTAKNIAKDSRKEGQEAMQSTKE